MADRATEARQMIAQARRMFIDEPYLNLQDLADHAEWALDERDRLTEVREAAAAFEADLSDYCDGPLRDRLRDALAAVEGTAARRGYDLPVREHPYVREIEARLRMACEPCAECGHCDYRELDDVLKGEPTRRYDAMWAEAAGMYECPRGWRSWGKCDPRLNSDGTATCLSCGWTGGWPATPGELPCGHSDAYLIELDEETGACSHPDCAVSAEPRETTDGD